MNGNENNQHTNDQGSFGLPGGYFRRSAGSIMNKIEWEEEHREFPQLQALKGQSGFTVPENYFVKSETALELLDCAALLSVAKKQVFGVPAGYFDAAELNALSSVLSERADELEGFETLASIPKQNSFKVNEDYFAVNEKLMNTLLKPDNKPARIIDLFFSKRSYVAAAFLVTCLGLWLYSLYIRPGQVEQDCGTIACVDRIDLVKAKNLESLDNEELYELVSPEELQRKLDGENAAPGAAKRTDSLDDLSDELPDEI